MTSRAVRATGAVGLVVLVLVVLSLAVTTDAQLRSAIVLLGLAALWLPMTLLISLCYTRRSA